MDSSIAAPLTGNAQTAPPERVLVTILPDVQALEAKPLSLSWSDLIERIRAPKKSNPTKASMPLIMMARLGDARSDKGSLRHGANVLEITGVALDYDGEELSISDAATFVSEAGVTGLFYSSPSSTPDRPRWRLLLPDAGAGDTISLGRRVANGSV